MAVVTTVWVVTNSKMVRPSPSQYKLDPSREQRSPAGLDSEQRT